MTEKRGSLRKSSYKVVYMTQKSIVRILIIKKTPHTYYNGIKTNRHFLGKASQLIIVHIQN